MDIVIDQRASLRAGVDRHPMLSLAAYVGAYAGLAALSVPGGVLFMLTGGFLFGGLVGGLAAVTAATLGATTLFLLVRGVLHDAFARRNFRAVQAFRGGFQRSAWSYMIALRLSPVFPFWLINVGAALANIPLRTFVVATALGIAPVALLIAFAGENLDAIVAETVATRDACRAAGDTACTASLPLRSVLAPSTLVGLLALSALALAPALGRVILDKRLRPRP